MQLNEEKMLTDLIQQQRVQALNVSQLQLRIGEEIQSLRQLKARKECFLNRYDQLFRYISLWLLVRGYDLTNYQPHQVLKTVCVLHCPDWEMDKIIRQRHQLKKKLSPMVSQDTYVELQHCLQYFQHYLQAYVCVSL